MYVRCVRRTAMKSFRVKLVMAFAEHSESVIARLRDPFRSRVERLFVAAHCELQEYRPYTFIILRQHLQLPLFSLFANNILTT